MTLVTCLECFTEWGMLDIRRFMTFYVTKVRLFKLQVNFKKIFMHDTQEIKTEY